MSRCRRFITCPVHGMARGARAMRRVLADQDAANHIAWAAHLVIPTEDKPPLPTVLELATELAAHTDGIPPYPAVRGQER